MRARAQDARRHGYRIAVVPTMGFLHEGHLALLRAGRARADLLILTIFVNPTQFGPGEDLDRYPRDEAGDLAKARDCGVDIAFCPAADAMYATNHQTFIEVRELQTPLCGASRPGHFAGVATIVAKLFHLTAPHVAIFGEKDFQQLALLRRMTADLDFDLEIVGLPIVREADGLAMSSRNKYLSPEQRREALALSRALMAANQRFAAGERAADALLEIARGELLSTSITLDYLELRDASTLESIAAIERPAVLAVAAAVGATRLIDNVVLAP